MLSIAVYALLLLSVPLLFILALRWLFRDELRALALYRSRGGAGWTCLRCPDCCRKTVLLSAAEARRIREFTGDAGESFVVKRLGIRSLRKTAEGDCVFLRRVGDGAGGVVSECGIYAERPGMCRRFPHLRYLGLRGLDGRCRALREHSRNRRD